MRNFEIKGLFEWLIYQYKKRNLDFSFNTNENHALVEKIEKEFNLELPLYIKSHFLYLAGKGIELQSWFLFNDFETLSRYNDSPETFNECKNYFLIAGEFDLYYGFLKSDSDRDPLILSIPPDGYVHDQSVGMKYSLFMCEMFNQDKYLVNKKKIENIIQANSITSTLTMVSELFHETTGEFIQCLLKNEKIAFKKKIFAYNRFRFLNIDKSSSVFLELNNAQSHSGLELERNDSQFLEELEKNGHRMKKISHIDDFNGSNIVLIQNKYIIACRIDTSFPSAKLIDSIPKLNELIFLETSNHTILEHLDSFEYLKYLKIFKIRLKKLPDSICNLTRLEILDLDGCKLTRLPENIGNLKNLLYLDLGNNKLETFPPSFRFLTKLQYLFLIRNPIKNLPERLEELLSLKIILILGTKLTAFPYGLFNLQNLEILYAEYNTKLKEFPKGKLHLPNIKEIILIQNQFETIPNYFSKLHTLEVLQISDNKIKELPMELAKLENLRFLDFKSNQIDKIPPDIGNLTKLQEINGILNNISEIPKEIFKLEKQGCKVFFDSYSSENYFGNT